jgi:hypothetical protein
MEVKPFLFLCLCGGLSLMAGCGSPKSSAVLPSKAQEAWNPANDPLRLSGNCETTYCREGIHLFGPFPLKLVQRCLAAGGGSACNSARWNRDFYLSLLP